MARPRGTGINLLGRRFSRLVVIARSTLPSRRHGMYLWECRCDCGTVKSIYSDQLRSGQTRSCGCLMRELHAARLRDNPFGRSRRGRFLPANGEQP